MRFSKVPRVARWGLGSRGWSCKLLCDEILYIPGGGSRDQWLEETDMVKGSPLAIRAMNRRQSLKGEMYRKAAALS